MPNDTGTQKGTRKRTPTDRLDPSQGGAEEAAARDLATGLMRRALEGTSGEENPDAKILEYVKTLRVDRAALADDRLDDVHGQDEVARVLRRVLIDAPEAPDLYAGTTPRGILLYGPSGTGKTMIARACANESGAAFMSVTCGNMGSKWEGESERTVRVLYEYANAQGAPTIVFFDEVDSLLQIRDHSNSDVGPKVVAAFLAATDGMQKNEVITIASTNRPWAIDPNALKRFDRMIYCAPPSSVEVRGKIAEQEYAKMMNASPVEPSLDWGKVARQLDGASGRDIHDVFKQAGVEAADSAKQATHWERHDGRLYVSTPTEGVAARYEDMSPEDRRVVQKAPLAMCHITAALSKIPISRDDEQKFREWQLKHHNTGS